MLSESDTEYEPSGSDAEESEEEEPPISRLPLDREDMYDPLL